jgi:SpoVK/Ycf46/Vps4 family AAA+-type ATPase
LLKVSASGIGATAKAAEDNLMKYFRLATSWEAIILLDEADVFLETRGTPGEKVFERNALVAVMLRILEYFDGVLFLTTNRVMKLDIAMLSRIHYAIHFSELTKDQETGIWNEQVGQLEVAKGNVTFKEKAKIKNYVESYQKRPRGARFNQRIGLNGREIHNVFKTAQHMANGDGGRQIRKEDLVDAIEAIENFRSEMRERVEKAERQLVVQDDQPDS